MVKTFGVVFRGIQRGLCQRQSSVRMCGDHLRRYAWDEKAERTFRRAELSERTSSWAFSARQGQRKCRSNNCNRERHMAKSRLAVLIVASLLLSSTAARSQSDTPGGVPAPALRALPPNKAAPAGGPGMVWANSSSKVYHCPGDKWFGKTKHGEYMAKSEASAKGYRPTHGKDCP